MIIELRDALNTMLNTRNLNIINSQISKPDKDYNLHIDYNLVGFETIHNIVVSYKGDKQSCEEDQKIIFANI